MKKLGLKNKLLVMVCLSFGVQQTAHPFISSLLNKIEDDELRNLARTTIQVASLAAIYKALPYASPAKWLKFKKLYDIPASEISSDVRRLVRKKIFQSSDLFSSIDADQKFFDVFFSLPWGKKTQETTDFDLAQRILNSEHSGLEDLKERVLEYIASKKLNPDTRPPLFCLVGPPGVGKTTIAQSIADSLNRKYIKMALGGVSAEAEIRGGLPQWIGAKSGAIVQSLIQSQSSNPVILLDEIDKVGRVGMQGDPVAALLELLDPAQNSAFKDHYLGIPINVSDVFFIATANSLEDIPGPLRDRMEIIHVSAYAVEEKIEICKKHILNSAQKSAGLERYNITMSDELIQYIIESYTQESGVRQLKQRVNKIFQHLAYQLASGANIETITLEEIVRILGQPIMHDTVHVLQDCIGQVNGLAYSVVGGSVMNKQAALVPGKGQLVLTGMMGKIMKEAAEVAYSYVRNHAQELNIDQSLFNRFDVHVHAPDGSTPKDGPSGGAAACTVIISALTNRPVRGDIAMTGEIDLHGNITMIGGVKEKLLAAKRKGITHVILPEKNRVSYNKHKALFGDLQVTFVNHISQVLPIALQAPAVL